MKEYIIKIEEGKKDINGGMPLVEPAKELIRCKDCRFAMPNPLKDIYCPLTKGFRNYDWFCAHGERKGEK